MTKIESKTVCVTGGSGFIGSWTIRLLLSRGYTVHATVKDLGDPKETTHLGALVSEAGVDSSRLQLFQLDLLNYETCLAAIKDTSGVFHLASPCTINCVIDPEKELLDPAVKGTINVLRSARDRLPDNSLKNRMQINGHEATPPETQKVSDGTMRKFAKPATTTESTGFGRNISKKSLDMALRHMDIRQGIRGASLFPQSIRSSAASKGRPGRMSDPVAPFSRNGTDSENNDCGISISGSYNGAISENDSSGIAMSPEREIMKRATAPDIYESTRYDTILMKEDSKT